jgi:hypothetical protein
MQFNSVQFSSIQFNLIQFNSIQLLEEKPDPSVMNLDALRLLAPGYDLNGVGDGNNNLDDSSNHGDSKRHSLASSVDTTISHNGDMLDVKAALR